jgi:DNA-directed RNA polymerase specialized sigma24 family protein
VADKHESELAADIVVDVTRMLDRVRKGDEDAVEPLLVHYFAQLKRYVLRTLSGVDRGVIDESALARDAYYSFVRWVATAPDPKLDCREDIRKVLWTIAFRKALRLHAKDIRRRNRIGPVCQASALEGADGSGGGIEGVAGGGPGPDEEVIGEDLYRHCMGLLDERQRRIAKLYLEECTVAEIATELGISVASVGRGLRKIRATWAPLLNGGDQ